ncbi:MAG: GntR family transcriptional regulator [Spirochaetaceae bacterium]|nr:GntR family transcriptional regulator [Spirochaetaceae bacterium]
MEFNQPKGIYQQIADQVRERIAGGEWAVGERIPSVREMAVTMGVNPNTVTRSYQTLQDGEIIDNRRGIGYFVAEKARERIMKELKTEFINDELPRLFRLMRKLDMGVEELVSLYEDYQGEDLA